MTGADRPPVEVLPLEAGVDRTPSLGGKAAALDRLLRSASPVPPTAVVTADAYRAVLADQDLGRFVARLRDTGAQASAEEVDAAFLAAPIPDRLADAITTAAREVGVGDPIAVRSSATVEDLAETSFAGQYRSSLNVDGDAAVLRATRLTWASLWHPAPRAYRAAWGVPEDDVAMAVVLMRMVPAEIAGVVFTVEPGGSTDVLRVEAVPGLAEALVSGARTPEVWRLARADVGTGEAPAAVRAAATEALRIERLGGVPQDVEWAWDGDRLWVVQARPITTGGSTRDPWDSPPGTGELTTVGVGEMLPGVLSPLLWEINAFAVEEALRSVLAELGAVTGDRSGAHEFVHRVHGRAALDLDLLKQVARSLPGGSEADVERGYFGAAVEEADEPAPAGRWRSAVHALRTASARRRAVVAAEILLVAVDRIVAAPPALTDLDDAWLCRYHDRLVDLGARMTAAELAVASAGTAAYQRVIDFLVPHLGEAEAEAEAGRVTRGAGDCRSVPATASRSVFGGPTWAETGEAAPGLVPAEEGRTHDRQRLESRLRHDRKWRRVRLLSGQLIDVRIHLLRRLIDDATTGLARRERVKAAFLTLGGEVRRVHRAMGGRLVARGVLADPDDVELLAVHELTTALRGGGERPSPAELARRRRALRAWRADPPLPVRFTGVPSSGQPAAATGNGASLAGWAAAAGRVTAHARTVTDPVHDRFDEGDVLVATATDAGWSPLFLRAGALVVERGGPLSHAAIVARELGIPAVLNLPGAASALDGRLVTVDGDHGVVTVHDGARATATVEEATR